MTSPRAGDRLTGLWEESGNLRFADHPTGTQRTDNAELGERIGLMTTVEVPERSQDHGTFGRSLKADDARRVGINWYGLQNCGTKRAP